MTTPVKQVIPEVSVLMSCYNGGRWLGEAIESVLAQTYRDFEFVIVDDGSKDNTLDIIRKYAAMDARIVVVQKSNTGLADSLNTGLASAKGAWIARVDQDDLCEPVRIERQLAFAHAHHGVVLLGSGFSEIDEHAAVIKKHAYPSGHAALVSRLEHLQGFFPHSSAFYKAAAVNSVGRYNIRITRAEDWRLWLELSLKGDIACLPEPLVRIRKHAGQMSLDNNGARQFCDAAAATVCHLLRKNGDTDPSTTPDPKAWTRFLVWIDNEIAGHGALVRRKAWGEARCAFFYSGNGVSGTIKCARRILMSGYAIELLYEKFFGSRLPEKLAREWVAAGKELSNKKLN